jgi:signal peptide peptidase SppA
MTIKFPHVRMAVLNHPWAIMSDRLEAIVEVLERRIEGGRLSAEQLDAIRGERKPNGVIELMALSASGAIEARSRSSSQQVSAGGAEPNSVIAVISISGIIAQHASQVDDISGPGGTSTERVGASIDAALADPAVKAIVLRSDSPGGNVNGVQVLADKIMKARGTKPIVAQVDSLCASAAYWICAACDEIVMTPGAQAGSIGVYALHQDVSAAAAAQGVKFTYISAGKYKTEGNPYEPIDGDALQAAQQNVDSFYADFVGGVAKGRGVKADDVRNGYGQGRVLKDKDAVKAGLADRVATFDDTLRRLASAKSGTSGSRAASDGTIQKITGTASALDVNATEPAATEGDDLPEPAPEPEQVVDLAPEPDETAIAAAQAAAERDAFRRRRFTHRMRGF